MKIGDLVKYRKADEGKILPFRPKGALLKSGIGVVIEFGKEMDSLTLRPYDTCKIMVNNLVFQVVPKHHIEKIV